MGDVQPIHSAWREPRAAHSAPLHKTPGSSCDFQAGFGQVRSGQLSTRLAKATELTAGLFPSWISCFFLQIVDVPRGQALGNCTKGLSSLPVICTKDTGGRGWQGEGEGSCGFKLAEDIPSSEVSCSKTEVTYRHTGFNSVAFTPASRAICGALDFLRSPPGAGGQGQERGDQALLEQLRRPGGTQGHLRWHLSKCEQEN